MKLEVGKSGRQKIAYGYVWRKAGAMQANDTA